MILLGITNMNLVYLSLKCLLTIKRYVCLALHLFLLGINNELVILLIFKIFSGNERCFTFWDL